MRARGRPAGFLWLSLDKLAEPGAVARLRAAGATAVVTSMEIRMRRRPGQPPAPDDAVEQLLQRPHFGHVHDLRVDLGLGCVPHGECLSDAAYTALWTFAAAVLLRSTQDSVLQIGSPRDPRVELGGWISVPHDPTPRHNHRLATLTDALQTQARMRTPSDPGITLLTFGPVAVRNPDAGPLLDAVLGLTVPVRTLVVPFRWVSMRQRESLGHAERLFVHMDGPGPHDDPAVAMLVRTGWTHLLGAAFAGELHLQFRSRRHPRLHPGVPPDDFEPAWPARPQCRRIVLDLLGPSVSSGVHRLVLDYEGEIVVRFLPDREDPWNAASVHDVLARILAVSLRGPVTAFVRLAPGLLGPHCNTRDLLFLVCKLVVDDDRLSLKLDGVGRAHWDTVVLPPFAGTLRVHSQPPVNYRPGERPPGAPHCFLDRAVQDRLITARRLHDRGQITFPADTAWRWSADVPKPEDYWRWDALYQYR